jgi:hypothetical protein
LVICDDDVERLRRGGNLFECLRSIAGRDHFASRAAENEREQPSHGGLVFNGQDPDVIFHLTITTEAGVRPPLGCDGKIRCAGECASLRGKGAFPSVERDDRAKNLAVTG